jgi:tripartite ATP-independent transporter DctM subunit
MIFFFILVLFLFAAGIPIGFSIGIGCLLFFVFFSPVPPVIIIQRMQDGVDSFTLMALPFFMLAAQLMNEAGITNRLVKLSDTMVGYIAGGLAHVNIVTSMIFAGMSGSAVADSAGVGGVLIPAMKAQGYDGRFSAVVTATSSTIGPIVPPSIPFVLYGVVGSVSIGRLFLGGAIPGVFMGIFLMVMVYILSKKRKYPKGASPSLGEFVIAFARSLPALFMPIIIVGGIVGGIFTPTEASAAAVVYSLIIGSFVYRTLTVRRIFRIFVDTAVFSGAIMFIVGTGTAMGWLLTREQVPQKLVLYFMSISQNPLIILASINVFLLLVGCIEGSIISIIILVPILMPLITKIGVDPVHFGVVMVLNLMIGLVTPPYGICMFVACRIANISIWDFTKELWPFLLALLAVLVLVTYFPAISLWLPNLLMGRS